MNDPASGTVQMLWRTYGPTLVTTGAALFSQIAPGQHQQQQRRQTSFFTERPQPQHASSSSSTMSRTQSVYERRRALEEELAALERIDPGNESDTSSLASPPTFPMPMPSMSMAANAMSSSSSRTTSPGSSPYLRERTASGVGIGRFEEIEIPPEGYDAGPDHSAPQPIRQRSSGWFGGWGSTMGGYERVKED
ncbi:hypothetical protein MPER_12333 [Moniliophthora perniciosa FA553]|nr:hypothetical protein MPER_12333 [Moniliophthora perniciosa FA553]